VLAAPRHGCINLHASLLPKYRGAAPINWAIVHGETETGVSLMQMDEGCDTGPVFVRRTIPIGPETTAGELAAQVAELCATVVREDLPRAVSGELSAVAQDDREATLAPLIKPKHRSIDWTRSARDIANLVRGMAPTPSATTMVRGKRVKLLQARAVDTQIGGPPGRVGLAPDRRILVATGDGALEVLRAQLEGRRALGAQDLVNGRALQDQDRLGT
jgi:methionyl-tRNA formyltransferase